MQYHEVKDKLIIGDYVYICDFRYNDIDNKPIRYVKPTRVIVCSNDDLPKNKTVYYSSHHFKPVDGSGKVKNQIIAPYDNTGFRSITGTSLNIYYDEKACVKKYREQCKSNIKEFKDALQRKTAFYVAKIDEIEEELKTC